LCANAFRAPTFRGILRLSIFPPFFGVETIDSLSLDQSPLEHPLSPRKLRMTPHSRADRHGGNRCRVSRLQPNCLDMRFSSLVRVNLCFFFSGFDQIALLFWTLVFYFELGLTADIISDPPPTEVPYLDPRPGL